MLLLIRPLVQAASISTELISGPAWIGKYPKQYRQMINIFPPDEKKRRKRPKREIDEEEAIIMILLEEDDDYGQGN